MAFGLDVTDLIYTDPNFVDQGTLEDYEVDLDLAGSMDFELRINEFLIEPKSLWYVEGTEIGGRIDGFGTDPTSNTIIYTGKSFRGMLASKILYARNSRNYITVTGRLRNIINRLLEQYGLDDFFVCEAEEKDGGGEISNRLDLYEFEPGTPLYFAMVYMGNELGYVYDLRYDNRDRKVHIYPIIPDDYTDYITYNKDNSAKFKVKRDDTITNHLIVSGIDENARRRTIHLFTNSDGQIQRYLKPGVKYPTKDDHYILDCSRQKLTGLDENVDYLDVNISADQNYERVRSKYKPEDWDKRYSTKYFKKVITPEYGEETIRVVNKKTRVIKLPYYVYGTDYKIKQADKTIKKTRTVKVKGKDVKKKNYWLHNYETIVLTDFDEDYIGEYVEVNGEKKRVPASGRLIVQYSGKLSNFKVTIGKDTLKQDSDYYVEQLIRSKEIKFRSNYKGQKVSVYPLTDRNVSYENPVATRTETYHRLTSKPPAWNRVYSYYYTRSWSQDEKKWTYSPANSESKPDFSNYVKVSSANPPSDWKNNSGQYYYKFNNGRTVEFRAYSTTSKDKYLKLKTKPDDWDKNFSSYYCIKYERKEYEETSSKKSVSKTSRIKYYNKPVENSKKVFKNVEGKEKKVKVDKTVKRTTVKYVKDGEFKKKKSAETKNKKIKYVKKVVAPKFRKGKYYTRKSRTVLPKYNRKNCYLPATKVVAPTWVKDKYYYRTVKAIKPDYKAGVYYKIVLDHYRGMVAQGVQHLLELRTVDSQNIEISDYELNIGDTVGGVDEVTGYEMSMAVTNKIIKIKNGLLTAEYEIGGEQ